MTEASGAGCDAFARRFFADASRCLASLDAGDVSRFVEAVERAYHDDRQVFVFGNGGSASTASHMACDLAKNIYPGGNSSGVRPFRVLSLNDNMALITALANDCGYDRIFAEQLSYYLRPGDLAIAISASGNSPNIVAALELAQARGARTAALLGFDGGRARTLAEVAVVVHSQDYGHVEDAHLSINHLVTAWMRQIVSGLAP